MRFGGQEILILALIVLLLFGASRLPKLARAMREAKDEFEREEEAPEEGTSTSDERSSEGTGSQPGSNT